MTAPDWENMLKGIDFNLPDGEKPPSMEEISKPSKKLPSRVFVQKVITEVWVYTDLEGKTFGHQGVQDVVILGDMDFNEVLKMIEQRKNKRRRSG